MANFDTQTYCNTFWMILKTSKKSTKYGPSDPVFITKILQKIQEQLWEHPWEILFLHIWDSEILKNGRSVYLTCRLSNFYFWHFDLLKFRKFEISSFEILKFGNSETYVVVFFAKIHCWEFVNCEFWMLIKTLKFWTFGISKTDNSNDEDPCKQIFKILDMNFISIKKHGHLITFHFQVSELQG